MAGLVPYPPDPVRPAGAPGVAQTTELPNPHPLVALSPVSAGRTTKTSPDRPPRSSPLYSPVFWPCDPDAVLPSTGNNFAPPAGPESAIAYPQLRPYTPRRTSTGAVCPPHTADIPGSHPSVGVESGCMQALCTVVHPPM
eukprot:GHVQ01016955.1.p1 GENE.GHVQ01016955.1~~GHVQ01016955.1.p1  ORF type:complete len:164 (+),score=12.75 GHVQ01016955.1:73-492(+)